MKILQFLDKLFDVTAKVESTIESVSQRTRLTVEKIIRDATRSILNVLIVFCSLLLVIAGVIIFASRYAPIEYILLIVGLLGFVYLGLQKISIKIN